MKTFSKDKKGDINGAFGIDLWQQEGKFGGNVELEYKRKITQDFFLNLNAGYKTEGYIVGYPQQPGLYFGIGATLRF